MIKVKLAFKLPLTTHVQTYYKIMYMGDSLCIVHTCIDNSLVEMGASRAPPGIFNETNFF